ncbi:MAG: hypothetical protein JNL82_03320 [Myxococcales bacterium]|nr:hypothetical protein [Myxococcales bacterium]
MRALLALLPASLLACTSTPAGGSGGSSGEAGDTGSGGEAPTTSDATTDATTGDVPPGMIPIPADDQRSGDPEAGYHALVNNGYVTCGIPWTAYSQVFGEAPEADRLPGRDGKNAALPYHQTAFTSAGGVELVSANCLQCHAGRINGELVIGLGDSTGDYTAPVGSTAALAAALLSDPAEQAELQRFVDRLAAIEPYTQTLTIGVNPADAVAAVLFAHRDRETFAWHDPPLLDLPEPAPIPVDVPPWWWMKKKHAMFYVAGGRGDHSRTMMASATLCTDDIDEARAIDAYFPDIHAYVTSIEPPKYPFAVDAALAAAGRPVFEATCSGCHGTYGPDGVYPNLLAPIAVVGTDPVLAQGAAQFSDRFLDWFNGSFYGEVAHLAPEQGYMAPPLDGVWASAPYFHNGSVPTVAAVLDSGARPTYWTRTFDSTDYDPAALGWQITALDHGQADEPAAAERKKIYDTTLPGHGNGGHPFGDGLTADERLAVLEYLKTL